MLNKRVLLVSHCSIEEYQNDPSYVTPGQQKD